jgi:hypothetical protein
MAGTAPAAWCRRLSLPTLMCYVNWSDKRLLVSRYWRGGVQCVGHVGASDPESNETIAAKAAWNKFRATGAVGAVTGFDQFHQTLGQRVKLFTAEVNLDLFHVCHDNAAIDIRQLTVRRHSQFADDRLDARGNPDRRREICNRPGFPGIEDVAQRKGAEPIYGCVRATADCHRSALFLPADRDR